MRCHRKYIVLDSMGVVCADFCRQGVIVGNPTFLVWSEQDPPLEERFTVMNQGVTMQVLELVL